jgi:hypothetical protein
MDDDIIVTLKRSNDLLMTFGNDYSDVFLPAIDEIERLREVLGMWLRYSKSDYDDHAQMIIDWSEAEAATKAALKDKE